MDGCSLDISDKCSDVLNNCNKIPAIKSILCATQTFVKSAHDKFKDHFQGKGIQFRDFANNLRESVRGLFVAGSGAAKAKIATLKTNV